MRSSLGGRGPPPPLPPKIRRFLLEYVTRLYPEGDADALATADWSLVHGLAFLHIDGKLTSSPRSEVEARTRSVVTAILNRPRIE